MVDQLVRIGKPVGDTDVAALWTFTISRAPASCTFRRCGKIVSESSVLSDCFTRVVFRVGDVDARFLADGFSSFVARDLQNLVLFLRRSSETSGIFNLRR
jgi:hypothetical protein